MDCSPRLPEQWSREEPWHFAVTLSCFIFFLFVSFGVFLAEAAFPYSGTYELKKHS